MPENAVIVPTHLIWMNAVQKKHLSIRPNIMRASVCASVRVVSWYHSAIYTSYESAVRTHISQTPNNDIVSEICIEYTLHINFIWCNSFITNFKSICVQHYILFTFEHNFLLLAFVSRCWIIFGKSMRTGK